MRKVVDYFWAGTDPRVYALVRIAVAIAALVNLIDLWPRRAMYFSDDGMMPLVAVRTATAGKLYESIFFSVTSVMTAVFLDILRFSMPMAWRIRWPKWDAFLCRCGSHRCIRICGSGCCWECIRCNPDDPNVKRRLELLGRTR